MSSADISTLRRWSKRIVQYWTAILPQSVVSLNETIEDNQEAVEKWVSLPVAGPLTKTAIIRIEKRKPLIHENID
jgi:hypothetical protein